MELCKKPCSCHLAAGTAKEDSFWIAILTDFASQNWSKWRSKKFYFAAVCGKILFTQSHNMFFRTLFLLILRSKINKNSVLKTFILPPKAAECFLHNLLPLIFLLPVACTPPPAEPPERAFYHWETRLDLKQEEEAYLHKLKINTLYTRFFDVDWEAGQAVPLAVIEPKSVPQGLRIVPAVFITNRTMYNIPEQEIPILAEKMIRKIAAIAIKLPKVTIDEVHIDCDWTTTTRDHYFFLLREIQAHGRAHGWRLSVTLRLHQWKYAQRTGVPPADLAMLMCYNTGELESWEEPNSILSKEALLPYLKGLEPYPIPLGIALPAFRWGIVFRDGELVRLLHGLHDQALSDTNRFAKLGPNRFIVKKNTYLEGHYLYAGDRIRLEQADVATCKNAAQLLRPALRRSPAKVIALYHLEPSLPKRMPYASTEKVFTAFDR